MVFCVISAHRGDLKALSWRMEDSVTFPAQTSSLPHFHSLLAQVISLSLMYLNTTYMPMTPQFTSSDRSCITYLYIHLPIRCFHLNKSAKISSIFPSNLFLPQTAPSFQLLRSKTWVHPEVHLLLPRCNPSAIPVGSIFKLDPESNHPLHVYLGLICHHF